METKTEKPVDYNHLILYAKGHYHRGNVIEDVKKILGARCWIDSVSDEDMWKMMVNALLNHARPHDLDEYLSNLFHPRYDEKIGVMVWFTNTCPLERAVKMVLTVLMRLRVIADDGTVILNLGEPDSKILPLTKRDSEPCPT